MSRGGAWVLFLLLFADHLAAAEPIRFFRLNVPNERVGDLGSTQGHKPMKAAEFQALLDALNGGGGGPLFAARVIKAQHTARFDGRQLVAGESTLTVERQDTKPRWIPWPAFGAAVSSAVWTETPPRPALLGQASTGEQGLWVDSSAELKLRWTLRGKVLPDGVVEIPLSLPQAMIGVLEVETVGGVRLESEADLPVDEIAPQALEGEERRPAGSGWRLSLGARHATKLRFVSATTPAAPQPRVLLREIANYEINPSSLDLRADWKLDISDAPLKQIVLQSDLETSLAEVRLGERNLIWSTHKESGRWTATVELPEPLGGQDRQLMIRALAPVKLGGRRKLPRIKLLGAVWREGESQVEVVEPLRVDDVFVKDGRQSAFVGETTADSRASLRFQHFTADSVPELTLSRSGGGLRAAAGTLVQIDAHRLTAVSQWDLSTESGERFQAEFELPRAWIVDSVETTPPEQLEDRVITALSPERQRLELRLRQPIRADRKLRLTIRAHCRRPSNEEGLSIALLRLAQLRDADQVRKLAAVEVLDSALQLQPAGDVDLEQLSPAQLPEDERRLLPSAGNLLFVDDERADGLQLMLERRRARFAAVTRHQITVERHLLDHQVNIRCTPEGASPRRMTVRVAGATASAVDWKSALITPEATSTAELLPGDFTARRLPATAGDMVGETWLLEWSRPPAGVFEVTARFSQGFDEPRALPLFSVPEAASQSGVLEIRAAEAGIFEVDAPETQPLPPDAASAGEPTVRERLRYEPARAIEAQILPRTGAALAPVFVRKLDLLTRFGVDGGALHQLRVELQNDGGNAWRFQLPAGAQLLQAAVDGRELEADYRPGEMNAWRTASLPADNERPLVEMTYSTPGWKDPIPWRNSWQVSLPQFESPVLSRRWRILTPPGFVLAGDDLQRTAYEESGIGSAGWTCFELAWPSADERRLAFMRPPRTQAFRGGLMLFIAGFVLLWRNLRTATVVTLLAAAGGLIALLPAAHIWIAEGALWGLAAALIVRGCQPQPITIVTLPRRGDTTTGAAAAASLSAVLLFSAVVHGQEAKPVEAKPYTVITPVDKQGKPTGDYVYVDPRLHALLRGGADRAPSKDVTWILGSADYRVVFRPAAETDLALQEVSAAWEIVTERPQSSIRLPLNVDDVVILGGLRVGEREIPVDWDRENKRLSFTIEEAGRHRVQLTYRPKTSVIPEGRVASVLIPPVPLARVTIESPAVGPEIECLAGDVRFVREAALQEASFEIGAAGKLQLKWLDAATGPKDTGSSGEQLLWWRVKPNAVSVDAFLRVKPGKEPLPAIDVEADPRLRLLPPDAALRLKTETITVGGETRRRITLPEPATREFTLSLSFQLQGESGLGRFVPPRIALKVDRLQRRWSGITSARGLALGASDRATSEPLPLHEFSGAWSTEDLPEVAFRATTGPETWSVDIRPDEPPPQAREQLAAAYTGGAVRLQYVAQITRLGSRRFLHRVRVPAEFQVERVTVEDAGESQTATWSRVRPDLLTVTVRDAEDDQDRTLTIHGRLPQGAATALPRITLVETELRECRVRVYRGETLRLECKPRPPFAAEEVKFEEWTPELGRLAAELFAKAPELKDVGSPAEIALQPNRPQVAGRIITRIDRAAGGWSAEVELEFEARDGLLDQLPLEVPAEWTAAKVLTADVDPQIRTATGAARRRFVLQPKRPWTGRQTIKLQGPLSIAESGFRVPDVTAKEGEWDRWVVLPKRVAPEVTWSLSGLQQSPPPEPTMTVDREYYRVVGPRFEAVMKAGELERGQAEITLATTKLTRGADGRIHGRTVFALAPQGLTACELRIPSGCDIIRATIDDRPALVRAVSTERLQIELVSGRLPQEVAVEFAVAEGGRQEVNLPALVGPLVKRSLFVFADAKPPLKAPSAATVTAADVEQLEADVLAAKSVAEVSDGGESPEVAAAWFVRRAPRFSARLHQLRLPTTIRTPDHSERIEAAERAFVVAAKSVVPAETPRRDATPVTWTDPLWEGSPAKVLLADGSLAVARVPSQTSFTADRSYSLLPALAWLALVLATAWAARQSFVIDFCRQRPQFALALAGVAWALFLPPSWFGWLLAGAAALSAAAPLGRSRWIEAR